MHSGCPCYWPLRLLLLIPCALAREIASRMFAPMPGTFNKSSTFWQGRFTMMRSDSYSPALR